MSREHLLEPDLDDEVDFSAAMNDEEYSRPRTARGDTLRARRRVEALLEERRLRHAIEDDWTLDEDEEE